MIDIIERFTSEYNYHVKTARVLPFKTAKYNFVKNAYWFYMQYSEIIRMIDNQRIGDDRIFPHRQYLGGIQSQLAESITKIMATEDINGLLSETEYFFNNIILPLNGYIRLYGNTFNILYYENRYNGVGYNETNINSLVENAISQLNFKRKEINAITILGVGEGFGNRIQEGCIDTLIQVPNWFKNNTINNYMMIDHDTTYQRIINDFGRFNLYKKIIYGSFEEVKTSTNFDFGFMGSLRLENYCRVTSEDYAHDLLVKMAELRSKVAKGGVMFLLMPRIFLSTPVLENIFMYMRNINIFFGGKSDAFALVVGNRKLLRDKKIDGIIEFMRHVASGENLRCPIDLECTPMAEVRFRSVTPSEGEIEEVIGAHSSFLHNFFSKATKNMELKTEEETRHPLIPFGPGQLGLVLVSGKIDGIVDEGNGIYHVIKGSTRVERNEYTARTTSMERTVETVTSTGVSVAMLTASGKYIQLA